jgi:glyoxylase-like metal-dependent hydrolase (beta-lactamase superfamily II)
MTRSHHFKIGAIGCRIVSDGSFTYEHPAVVMFATAPAAEREAALREHDINPETWTEYVSPYSALLVETGQRRVLVDTGAGGFAPTNGELHENLRAEGVDFSTIDTVVLTHAHPDHIGGNLDAEMRPAFPNARYTLWRDEWQFWTGRPDLSGMPIPDELKQLLIESAQRNLPPVEGQAELLERDTEVAPGVRVLGAAGHTPGHLVVEVASEGQRLLWLGDTALHPITVAHPGWCAAFDFDCEEAVATRNRLLARAADEQTLVHAAHFPWPGLGRVVRDGSSFRWQPITEREPS